MFPDQAVVPSSPRRLSLSKNPRPPGPEPPHAETSEVEIPPKQWARRRSVGSDAPDSKEEFEQWMDTKSTADAVAMLNEDDPADMDSDRMFALLQHASSVEMRCARTGTAPIHLAVLKNNLKLLTYLIETRRCHIEVVNSMGRTPLHLACELGRAQACEMLLRRGANTHAATLALWTPLHFATAYGHNDVVKLILSNEYYKPVYTDVVTNIGQTARDLVSSGPQSQVVFAMLDMFKRKFTAQRKWNLSMRVLMVLIRLRRKFLLRRRQRTLRRFSASTVVSNEAMARFANAD